MRHFLIATAHYLQTDRNYMQQIFLLQMLQTSTVSGNNLATK